MADWRTHPRAHRRYRIPKCGLRCRPCYAQRLQRGVTKPQCQLDQTASELKPDLHEAVERFLILVARRIQKKPGLIMFKNGWIRGKIIDEVLPRYRRREQAMNKQDRDLFRIVRMDQIN